MITPCPSCNRRPDYYEGEFFDCECTEEEIKAAIERKEIEDGCPPIPIE